MIVSRQNAFIKQIRSLSDKKYRDALNLYVAEGVKTVNEAIRSEQKIYAIVGTERGLSQIDRNVFRTETVSEDVFKSISGEVSPQGVLAVIEKSENVFSAPDSSCLLLDGVSDPSNVGAIIRTAAACGYNRIYLVDTADPYGPKAVRASMSGIFKVKIYRVGREEFVNANALPIIIADMDGENVFETQTDGAVCVVVGNEGNGVSEFMKLHADKTVSIPMQNGMESLNASVSAGIIMYALKK